jgi:membrane protein
MATRDQPMNSPARNSNGAGFYDESAKPRQHSRPLLRFLSAAKYYLIGVWKRIDEDHCFLHASGIAYNVFLSIIPLSLLLLEAVSTFVQRSVQGPKIVVNWITQSIPDAAYQNYEPKINAALQTLLNTLSHSSHWAGIVGGLTLMWLGSALFSTLRTTMNHIFRLKARSNGILLKLLDFLMMIVVIILFLILPLIWPVVKYVIVHGGSLFPGPLASLMKTGLPFVISLTISIIMYYMLYRILPYQRLPNKVIAVSALTTVALIEVVKIGFSIYMQHASSIGTLYGAYAFLIGIALWIYYVSIVFTLGAEVGWLYWMRHEAQLGGRNREVLSSAS